MIPRYDFAIAGAGMAGASLAAALVPSGARVVLLEAEDRAGYHATGRSAAFWTESYGGPAVFPLTAASGPILRDGGYLYQRGALTIARSGQEAELEAFANRFATLGVRVERVDRAGLESHIPGLKSDWCAGVLEPDCCDIDVARLHQDYLATAKQGGADLWCSARLECAVRDGDGWLITCAGGQQVRAGVLINAGGAWVDAVATLAGVKPIGITPYRRTVAQIRTAPPPPSTLPLVLDLGESFYFKPESGRIWLSPHDEVPSAPCDAAPEELAVAEAIDRFGRVVDWQVEHVEHRWAGLRSFAPDRLPVYGFDRGEPRFFWFAGQGGFGIQTAPAAAALGAALALGEKPQAVDPAPFLPDRFG